MEGSELPKATLRQAELSALKRPNVEISYEHIEGKGGFLTDRKTVGNCIFVETREYDPTGEFRRGTFERKVKVGDKAELVDTVSIYRSIIESEGFITKRKIEKPEYLKLWTVEFRKACAEKQQATTE